MPESRTVNLNGPVHYVDHGGEGTPIVLVHGLGGSHVNWSDVGQPLTAHGRVLALDLAGFGLTPPAGRSSSVRANRRLLDRFIAEVAGERAILIGNSMGGLISMMQAAMRPGTVEALILVNPAVPPAGLMRTSPGAVVRLILPTAPIVGPAFLDAYLRRRPVERYVAETLDFVCADPGRVSADHIGHSIEMARKRRTMPWASRSFVDASRSIARSLARRSSFDSMAAAVSAPNGGVASIARSAVSSRSATCSAASRSAYGRTTAACPAPRRYGVSRGRRRERVACPSRRSRWPSSRSGCSALTAR